jgi:hypothetical protein
VSVEGVKGDQGKPPIFRGVFVQFPRAIESIAILSRFGANKYSWENWKHVDQGIDRYSDAMLRHLVAETKGEILDPESGLPHAWSTAWNALARLELIERNNG